MGQLVELVGTWKEPKFHCPACGQLVLDSDGTTNGHCRHLAFTWISELGEFMEAAPEIIEILENQLDEEEDEELGEGDNGGIIAATGPCEEEFINALADDCVIFQINFRDGACGPASLTVAIGIFFDGRPQEQDVKLVR